MPNKFRTREEWLNFVADALRPYYKSKGAEIPAKVRYSVGFTSNGYRGKDVAECWKSTASGDNTIEILIKPTRDKPEIVAGDLAHELIHAADDCKHGHRAPFKRMALALGFEGKMTECSPGPVMMREVIAPILKKAGPLPHSKLSAFRVKKKQSTRLLKAECLVCGYTVRLTEKWLSLGAPYCGHIRSHGRLAADQNYDDGEE